MTTPTTEPAPVFDHLAWCDERAAPRRPAANMAMDEALLRTATVPVLRCYAWDRPAFSFGYFLRFADAAAAAGPERTLVRRWTGGGMVPHGEDFTWSLVVPRAHPAAALPPPLSYQLFHSALAAALAQSGRDVSQVPAERTAPAGGLCLHAPAPGDLLLAGRKIAGAGQRRSRHGLLHQGTIALPDLPHDFPALLAAALAAKAAATPPASLPSSLADELESTRYATDTWLRLR